MQSNRLWVLGGNDGEMEVIKTLLGMAGDQWIQPKTSWGDLQYKIDDLSDLVARPLRSFSEVVFVECKPVYGKIKLFSIWVIDHHGDRANESASVLQVLRVLEKSGLQISDATRRWVGLIAANDTGAYAGMEMLGATLDEMARVRALTRRAQGITQEHEDTARTALESAKANGLVLVAQVAEGKHIKNVCFLDALHQAGRGNELYLLVGSGSFHFSGDGAICAKLHKEFSGWAGGAGLGKKGDQRAFWGFNGPNEKLDEILAEINQ